MTSTLNNDISEVESVCVHFSLLVIISNHCLKFAYSNPCFQEWMNLDHHLFKFIKMFCYEILHE